MFITKAEKKQNYHGFKIQVGHIFGRDDKSPFVTTGKMCVDGSMMMWREHIERGWAIEYEKSATTRAVCQIHKPHHSKEKPGTGAKQIGYVCNYGHTRVFR